MEGRAESCLGSEGWWWWSPLSAMPPPVAHTAVHDPQHGNTAGTVSQEVGEAGTQGWSQLVLGQAPQAVFSCPAPALQLPQVLSQLLKVHLEKQGVTCSPPIERHCLRLPLCWDGQPGP